MNALSLERGSGFRHGCQSFPSPWGEGQGGKELDAEVAFERAEEGQPLQTARRGRKVSVPCFVAFLNSTTAADMLTAPRPLSLLAADSPRRERLRMRCPR